MAVNYREYLSIRGIFLIVLGMAGSIVGNYVLKSGVQSGTTFLYSNLLFLICFFAIILGISVWGWDILSGCKKTAETEMPGDDTVSPQETSPREDKSLTFAGAGTLLILGLLHFLKIWKIESDGIWLFAGVFCGVAIAIFALLYVSGYYIIYNPR